ncbi:hypothetical protein COL63_22375 [Bacillus pseudomycoides]|uniref:N-acetylmuramoyl-L-alanine amidase family protein n=1 Tax=Bacillus pseudomycoides TaxID=64104 RepID=UPI000BF6B6DB|nr:C39 family peptidase [Bacillus pseudomycoides]PFZ09502.1 hypothetical protein COL63_22375 [Bacillus pseudomycoides]
MKKILFYIFSYTLTLGLFLAFPISSHAAEISTQTISKAEAISKAENYLKVVSTSSYHKWKDAYFSESKILYDLEGKITGYLFQVTKEDGNLGYIIANSNKNGSSILESTRKGLNPYHNVQEGQAIYIGPLQHFKKEDDKIINLNTNESNNIKEISKKQASPSNLEQKDSHNSIQEDPPPPDIFPGLKGKKIQGVPDFMWYRGCTPTAIANLIGYWDQHGYNNLVQGSTTSSQFIDALGDDMKTTKEGNTLESNMAPGIRKYWNDRGYYPSVKTDETPTFNEFVSEIEQNRLVIISTEKSPTYENHTLTGIGYEQFTDPFTNEQLNDIIVHDTWNTTPEEVYVSFNTQSQYIDGYITVNPSSKGWIQDGYDKWHFFDAPGVMKTGWIQDNGKWYYLDSSGVMKTGWIQDNGKWYYLDSSGAMKTGWIQDRYWYYLDSSGAMKTGWAQDSGKWYYLGSSGAMFSNGWITVDGKSYYLRADGSWDENKK